jgi:purine-binding chemotaxis protein CheW
MQYLTFRMDGVEYAVDVRIVETVVEHGEIMSVPTPLKYMKGAMDLRGRVIPVVDLRKKFDLPDRADARGGIVVVFAAGSGGGGAGLTVGALVDEVSEVLDIDEGRVESARGEALALWERYVRGVIRLEGRMIVVIEPEGLFSIGEIAEMKIA